MPTKTGLKFRFENVRRIRQTCEQQLTATMDRIETTKEAVEVWRKCETASGSRNDRYLRETCEHQLDHLILFTNDVKNEIVVWRNRETEAREEYLDAGGDPLNLPPS